MRKISRMAVVAAAVAAAASTTLATQAHADVQPAANDIVGVGSDTVQNIMNFVADGDTAGDAGFNTSVTNRVINFDATPDANDRAGYLNGSTSLALKALNPTIVLRQGASPVQRPNGSGAGISALLADTAAPYKINYVRASRLPTAAEEATAGDGTHNFGGLRVVQIAQDPLQAAVASTTNAPATLTATQLVNIYECNTGYTNWGSSALGGTTSANSIIPEIPQTGSGTRSTFLADLAAANGGATVPLGQCVQTVEENDPTSLTGATSPADAVVPFSGGRLTLYNNSYFKDPTVANGKGTTLVPGIKLIGGSTAPSSSYLDVRGLYIVIRANDTTLTAPFEPGGTKNWAQTLFIENAAKAKPFVENTNNAALFAASGVSQAFKDCGLNPTSC